MADWTALFTEDGEAHSAFVRGHVDLDELAADGSADAIIAEFDMTAIDVRADQPFCLEHFWMKRLPDTGDLEGLHDICQPDEDGAFPVTGVRFPL